MPFTQGDADTYFRYPDQWATARQMAEDLLEVASKLRQWVGSSDLFLDVIRVAHALDRACSLPPEYDVRFFMPDGSIPVGEAATNEQYDEWCEKQLIAIPTTPLPRQVYTVHTWAWLIDHWVPVTMSAYEPLPP